MLRLINYLCTDSLTSQSELEICLIRRLGVLLVDKNIKKILSNQIFNLVYFKIIESKNMLRLINYFCTDSLTSQSELEICLIRRLGVLLVDKNIKKILSNQIFNLVYFKIIESKNMLRLINYFCTDSLKSQSELEICLIRRLGVLLVDKNIKKILSNQIFNLVYFKIIESKNMLRLINYFFTDSLKSRFD
jgi:hypothetical protein